MTGMKQQYEQKDNDLVLFKNEKKESDKHPDYKGSGRVNGVDVWLSAWVNKSAAGVTYMSLKTQNKDDVQSAGVSQARQALDNSVPADGFGDLEDSSVPF